MAKNTGSFGTITLAPLNGMLDTRSRPADVPVGAWRWKQSWQVDSLGKLRRRGGHERVWSDFLYDSEGYLFSDSNHNPANTAVFLHNHDLHRQGDAREPITLLFESTDNDGARRLFAGTQGRLYLLNADTGEWTTLQSGLGSYQSRFKAAELQDRVLFTNNVNDILAYDINTLAISTIPELQADGYSAAKVIIRFKGIIAIMNTRYNGERHASRVRWCDLNDPMSWTLADTPDTLANFQELDYGDAILAAAPIQDSVLIYCERSIWRMTISSDPDKTFDFAKIYTEPKNQAKCLAFENTLISTGNDHYYLGRDAIYHFNLFQAEPDRPDEKQSDWLHRASGVIYAGDKKVDANFCQSPVGEYRPETRELWFSWPGPQRNGINNWCLVCNVEQRTADVVDTGYTAFANFRRNAVVAGECNELQDFIGSSGVDYCLKSIGTVFFRQFIVFSVLIDDITTTYPVYENLGYASILRTQIATGYYDRDKTLNNLLVDHETAEQSAPCALFLRVGNSYTLVDSNSNGARCAVLWQDSFPPRLLECANQQTVASLKAAKRKADTALEWPVYESNRYLYFELTVKNEDGTPAIGADTALSHIDFSLAALPEPV